MTNTLKIVEDKRIRITQRKEDCHYETTLWDDRHMRMGGWFPFLFGYGHTQDEADKNLLKQLTSSQRY